MMILRLKKTENDFEVKKTKDKIKKERKKKEKEEKDE